MVAAGFSLSWAPGQSYLVTEAGLCVWGCHVTAMGLVVQGYQIRLAGMEQQVHVSVQAMCQCVGAAMYIAPQGIKIGWGLHSSRRWGRPSVLLFKAFVQSCTLLVKARKDNILKR